MFSPTGYLILLALSLPITLWACWSDLKSMKIPNKSVLALGLVFLIAGLFLLPTWRDYLWALALLGIVLVIGFLLSSMSLVGAGDAKLAAAMAPFFVGGDVALIMYLYAGCSLGALIIHRSLKRVPVIRRMTPDWISWDISRYFPMGFALVAGFLAYLAIMASTVFTG